MIYDSVDGSEDIKKYGTGSEKQNCIPLDENTDTKEKQSDRVEPVEKKGHLGFRLTCKSV